MHYNVSENNHGLARDPFKACFAPRAIGWISSISKDGIDNLAPFSQFQNLSYDPPLVMISLNQSGKGDNVHRKDTVNNIEKTGCFVYNMVTYDLREKMNITAPPYPSDVDEFEKAGLTKADCIRIPAHRVAESPVQFECEYLQTIRFPGKSEAGTADMIIGRVLEVHINDDVILPNGKIDYAKIKPLARMGYFDYAYVSETFEMKPPMLPDSAISSMEGIPDSKR